MLDGLVRLILTANTKGPIRGNEKAVQFLSHGAKGKQVPFGVVLLGVILGGICFVKLEARSTETPSP